MRSEEGRMSGGVFEKIAGNSEYLAESKEGGLEGMQIWWHVQVAARSKGSIGDCLRGARPLHHVTNCDE